jgi:precorrin-6A/cobalt-precorrin-6A reductase
MARRKSLLILGGTAEARQLADRLAGHEALDVMTSLAGRTRSPTRPAGMLRQGGFGGAAGLRSYLAAERIAAVVDATHPFAATISAHCTEACRAVDLPLLRLVRPPWQPQPGDRWVSVPDAAAAADRLPALGRHVFLTTGHKDIAAFADLAACRFLVRLIEPPLEALPANMELLLDRGPFDRASETALLRDLGIEVVVTKNSGGRATAAKLEAALDLGLPVLMIERPALPDCESVESIEAAANWVLETVL